MCKDHTARYGGAMAYTEDIAKINYKGLNLMNTDREGVSFDDMLNMYPMIGKMQKVKALYNNVAKK